jgi:predicted DNA-binding transcriptional regulator AlpA
MRLLSYADLKDKGIPLGKCQLWRLERDRKFPKRVYPTARSVAWREADIDQYLADRGCSTPQMAAA